MGDTVKLPEATCKRCGWVWVPRVKKPRWCPKCNSPYWNRERTRESESMPRARQRQREEEPEAVAAEA